MEYRTVIEIVCDADDEDEACFVAGEYLRGNADREVMMNFCIIPVERPLR